jgi:hypothetical protein
MTILLIAAAAFVILNLLPGGDLSRPMDMHGNYLDGKEPRRQRI